MNRPFALLGFTYIAGLFVAACFSSLSLLLGVTFFMLFVISLFFDSLRVRKTIPIIFLTLTAAFFVHDTFNNLENEKSQKLVDHDSTITGTICEAPIESSGKQYYVIKTDKVSIEGLDSVPQNIKVRVSKTSAFDCDVFDKITGKIHFYKKESDGIFSSKNYYAARGIHNFAYFYEYEDYVTTDNTARPLYYYCIKCKQALVSSLRELLPQRYYSIATGILLGDKYFIDDDVMSDFKDIGISHLLSVSGLHVSIIAQFFVNLFFALNLSKRKTYLFSCLGILLFMSIVGFTPSVVRAGIMLIIAYVGKAFFKSSDSLNSLGFATLCLSVANPFAGSDVGLLLSICSTLGIILFSDKLNFLVLTRLKNSKLINSVTTYIISTLCMTITATIATAPITIFYFKKFSLVSLLANLLMVVPSMAVLVISLLSAITNVFGFLRFISMPLGALNAILIEYLINCAKVLAAIPFASVSTAQPFLLFWVASTLIIFAVDLILNDKFKIRSLPALLSVALLFVGILSYQILNENKTSLATVDVGTGCSVVLSKSGHAAVLACGGEEYEGGKLNTYLESQNIKKLDYLVLSDLKEKTSCYAKDIINKYEPDHVVLPHSNDIDSRLSRTIADKSNLCYFYQQSNVKCWDNVNMAIVNYGEQSFIYLTVEGVNVLICPSGGNMSYIPPEYNSCDIFIEGVFPEKLNYINSNYMIMSNNLNLVNSRIKDVVNSSKIPMATAGDGNIVIDFATNKTISFRRVKL